MVKDKDKDKNNNNNSSHSLVFGRCPQTNRKNLNTILERLMKAALNR